MWGLRFDSNQIVIYLHIYLTTKVYEEKIKKSKYSGVLLHY